MKRLLFSHIVKNRDMPRTKTERERHRHRHTYKIKSHSPSINKTFFFNTMTTATFVFALRRDETLQNCGPKHVVDSKGAPPSLSAVPRHQGGAGQCTLRAPFSWPGRKGKQLVLPCPGARAPLSGWHVSGCQHSIPQA